jgi:hypothetical protein
MVERWRGRERLATIRYDQAVYGSFPFWHRGYALLARSEGCRTDWLDALRLAGQRFGERPAGVVEKPCLFSLHLSGGPWMIVRVFPQGVDDQGRPGALAFHALFASRWAYQWAGANPFVFLPALRGDWKADDQDRPLETGQLIVEPQDLVGSRGTDRRIEMITAALTRGQRVTIVSSAPIDGLARAVWVSLSSRVRRRATVATWAFSNANQFDLVAGPRLFQLAPGLSDLVLDEENGSGQ